MAYDVVIRNGRVVDGSGFGSYRGDVGIVDGVIARVGRIRERGDREIDAEGHVVTPGFIDGHTHLDAQVFWDPQGANSCWHGVTTAVMGNCGFTLAPVRDDARALVVRNLERAEDIDPVALASLEWGWETFPEYLDAVDRLPKAINYAANVGHSALRTWAMGERAFEEEATDDDLALMRGQLARCAGRGRDRAHDVAQRAPRDVRQPPGGVAARRVVGAVRPGRRDGRRRPRHARRWQRARALARSRPTRAGAHAHARPGRGDGRADDDGHHRHQPGRLRDARADRLGRRGRRAHDRPVALPRHQRAAVVRDPLAVRPAARVARRARAARRRAAARAARPVGARAVDPRRHGGRLLAVARHRGHAPQARLRRHPGLRARAAAEPDDQRGRGATGRHPGGGDDRPRARDRPRPVVHPAEPLPAGPRRAARGHAPPAHGDDVLRLGCAPQPDRRRVDPHPPARVLGARPPGVHAGGSGAHAHAGAGDGVGLHRPRARARGDGRRPQRVRSRARRSRGARGRARPAARRQAPRAAGRGVQGDGRRRRDHHRRRRGDRRAAGAARAERADSALRPTASKPSGRRGGGCTRCRRA